MAKNRGDLPLSAAECARRTGLTVRALRVYERYGLVKPQRSANGWRRYGPKELARLNTIVALKGLGLTLAQIREMLCAKSLSLARVLAMQLEIWRNRKTATDKVIAVIERALGKLKGREKLSTDELCALLKSSDVQEAPGLSRDATDDLFTAEELREWRAHDVLLARLGMPLPRQAIEKLHGISFEYRDLMARGVPPGSAEAQALLARHNGLLLESGLRRQYLVRAVWNLPLARKVFAYSNHKLERAAVTGSAAAGTLIDYMFGVRMASRWWRLLAGIIELAKGLKSRGAMLDSAVAEDLARACIKVCRRYGLGDAAELAEWYARFGMTVAGGRASPYDPETQAAWEYLRDAVLTLSGERLQSEALALQGAGALPAAELRRYTSPDGAFALDIPVHWRTAPAVPANSPRELVRFASHWSGVHILIIFGGPQEPAHTLAVRVALVKQILAGKGFANFATAETLIGAREARLLDFDRPLGAGTWSCREYFVTDGVHSYTLGFGTTNKLLMFELFDRMAKSFVIAAQGGTKAA